MYEDITSIFKLNKTKPLFLIEPFDCSSTHNCLLEMPDNEGLEGIALSMY